MENDANVQHIEVDLEKSVQVIHSVAERGEVEVWEESGGTYTIVTSTASKPFLCQIVRKLDRGEIVTLLTKTIDGYEDIVSTPSHDAADCLSTGAAPAGKPCGGFRRRWRAEQLRSVTWPSSWISGLTRRPLALREVILIWSSSIHSSRPDRIPLLQGPAAADARSQVPGPTDEPWPRFLPLPRRHAPRFEAVKHAPDTDWRTEDLRLRDVTYLYR